MNIKFLDKVCDQILSETMINNDKLYTPFLFPSSFSLPFFFSLISPFLFSIHCRDVYCLNKEEIDYVWTKYKEGITAIMDKKELC